MIIAQGAHCTWSLCSDDYGHLCDLSMKSIAWVHHHETADYWLAHCLFGSFNDNKLSYLLPFGLLSRYSQCVKGL